MSARKSNEAVLRSRAAARWFSRALVLAVVGAAGCQAIAGIEERHLELEAGAVKKKVSAACEQYCTDITDTCIKDDAQYADRDACRDVCALIPDGKPKEIERQTVACREAQVQSAMIGEPHDSCLAAGPGGGTTCGSDCESYCALFTAACSDKFPTPQHCVQSCEGLRTGTWTVISAAGDTLACRLYHVSAAAGDPKTHCPHARLAPSTAPCADDADKPPDCADYCKFVMATCAGPTGQGDGGHELAVYESEEDCLATCKALPIGTNGDIDGNTVGCRHYHTYNAVVDADTHCPHAGPAGDGHCGNRCDAYCAIAAHACSTEYAAEFGAGADGDAACAAECKGLTGHDADSPYVLATAVGNTVQCRIKEAVGAFSTPARCAGAFGKASPCR